MSVAVEAAEVTTILTTLIGRKVTANVIDSVEPHPATMRGMVTDDDRLVAVIGSDLEFAHRASAALAMVPADRCDALGGNPDADLLEIYREVTNVLSRLVDEATPMRVRLDPAMDHDDEAMAAITAAGSPVIMCETEIEGYGAGRFAVWYQA